MSSMRNAFGARDTLSAASASYAFYRLDALTGQTNLPLEHLPFTVRILLENALRMTDLEPTLVSEADVAALARWKPGASPPPASQRSFPSCPRA